MMSKLYKVLYFIIIFFILVFIAHPFYMKQSVYEWVYKNIFENKYAVVDIYSSDIHAINIAGNLDSVKTDIPYYCKDLNDESCISIEMPINNKWKSYEFSINANNNATNYIHLSGPADWRENRHYPILVDYKDFFVNGNAVNLPKDSFWFTDTFEFSDFNFENGQNFVLSVKARKHHLKPGDVKLIYKTLPLKISSVPSLIGTVLVVLYALLLIYFKKFKHLFCFIIFIFLILPFIYMSKEDISVQENRKLCKFPAIFIGDRKINEKFGIEFNDWFADRFWGRQELINSRFHILYFINNKVADERAFLGDNEWMFPTKSTKDILPMKDQRAKISKTADALKKIDNYFNGKNVQIYLVLEPNRSELYKKYWENYYPHIEAFEYYKELKEELKEHPNIHFIDLEEEFEVNKDKIQLYEKNDPHMTLPAVNIMLEKVISVLDKDIPDKNLYEQYKKSITYQDENCKLYSFLNLYDDFLKIQSAENTEICHKIAIKNSHIHFIKNDVGFQEVIVSKPYIDKDLYIMFICYGKFVFPVFAEFFSDTISVNQNTFEEHDAEALKNNAISKLKSVKPGTIILIFLSYPTENNISKSTEYLEEF